MKVVELDLHAKRVEQDGHLFSRLYLKKNVSHGYT